jgi:hypothetical protein
MVILIITSCDPVIKSSTSTFNTYVQSMSIKINISAFIYLLIYYCQPRWVSIQGAHTERFVCADQPTKELQQGQGRKAQKRIRGY